jgi:hypothetical protein
VKDTIQNLMYMRLIGNISREFQRGRLYHPLRIQMTVVKVCMYIYIYIYLALTSNVSVIFTQRRQFVCQT